MKQQLVISRYQEPIEWIDEYNIPTFIYNKGSLLKTKYNVIELPNIGREGHTYLHHIIMNYNNLADVTIFSPASVFGNKKKLKKFKLVVKYALKEKSVIIGVYHERLIKLMKNFTLDNWECTNKYNRKKSCAKLELSSLRPFGKWYTEFINKPCEYFVTGGIFAMHKKNILQKPLIFYIRLILELQTHNPEAGHYLERSWAGIFSPMTDTIFIKDSY